MIVVWVCDCGVGVWCVQCVFFNKYYLQHVPLHGNTTCSSVHMIHCLSFWSACMRIRLWAVPLWRWGLITVGAKKYFLQSVATGMESYPVACPASTGDDHHGIEADHSPPSSALVNSAWIYA